ncbi:MAG: N-acetylglutaminylglutamine amidotransferase [Gammaproteobacteria bacterium]|nr:N-acetylglutaminylglutamine amidotransferase [Gammaproteobacteria bacterium]
MCGICGELRFDGQQADAKVVRNMTSKLERRGPDSMGEYFDGPLGFGHRRLSIIDLSERSHQPMLDRELGLNIVFNGTIYNYRILREELKAKGYQFFSDGDTEVIIKAYHAWGASCVERLHGMFAFAIWDMNKRQLFLARDRFGIKPFYYSFDKKRLRFASTTQSILAAKDSDTSIDPVALHNLFSLHAVVPAPRTILNGIRKVRPATYMIVHDNGQVEEKTYWRLNAQRPATAKNESEWQELIHAALRSAVQKRKEIADVPVGVLLSGGLDSSLLVALLAEAGVQDLRTFSIGFEDIGDEKGSEFEFSDQVVERYQTKHTRLHIPNSEVLPRLPEAVDQMTEPMFGQDAVAFYLLAEQVSQHVKVVQSGQGADEVFGGYFWYPQMHDATGKPLERFRNYYFDRDHDEFARMLTPAWYSEDFTSALVEQALSEPNADTFIDQVLRFDCTTLIVDDPVKRVDNMTMAWGLEARVPFLDHELVELAAAMPPELKLQSGGKHLLKNISRGLIPDAVIDRPKGYFPMPALKYVQGDFLNFMRDILMSDACLQRDIYQRDYVERLLSEPESHFTRIKGSKLWHLALLEFWLQRNVDAA